MRHGNSPRAPRWGVTYPAALQPPAGWAVASLLVALQAAAYLVVLLPMSFGFLNLVGLELLKYQLITATNAFAGPVLLLLAVHLTRSRAYVLLHHLAQAVLLVGVSMYIQYFGALPHLNLLRQIGMLPAVTRQIAVQLVGVRELAAILLLVASTVVAFRVVRRERGRRRSTAWLVLLAVGVGLFVARDAFLNSRLPIWKYRYEGIYFLKRYGFLPILASQALEELRHRSKTVPWPGMLDADNCRELDLPPSRPNILLVQVESLDPWIIEHQVAGKPVMPFLRDLTRRSLTFANFFSAHRGGGSADAELACLAGLVPLGSHAGFATADFSRIMSLPHVLSALGYYTCALHANTGSFYYRRPAFQALGLTDFFDRDAYSSQAAGWRSRDLDFFEQSLEILDRSPQPFFAYLITMQSHGPFDNHSMPLGTFAIEPGSDVTTRDYVLTMHEVDRALATLATGLERRGWLAGTLLVIFSDHQSTLSSPDAPRAPQAPGEDGRIPLLFIGPPVFPEVSYKVGSHLDIGPTILHLIGAPPVAYSMGRSLLDSGIGRAFLTIQGSLTLIRNAAAGSRELVTDRDVAPFAPFFEFSESVLHP